jgi:hypothetical protein
MVNFKADDYIYAIIAAILAFIGVFVPAGGYEGAGITVYTWFGAAIANSADLTPEWQAAGTTAGLYALGAALISATLLLFIGISKWRGKEYKWDWLIYLLTGIAMIIFPILYWVYAEAPTGFNAVFGAAPLLVLIGGVVALVGFVVEKMLAK